jgi:hypothetical protein
MIPEILIIILSIPIIHGAIPSHLFANGEGRQIYKGVSDQLLTTIGVTLSTPSPRLIHFTT